MIMALRTSHGQTKPGGRGGIDAIKQDYIALLFSNGPALTIKQMIPVEPGGNFLILSRIRKKIARKLPDGELIKRQIIIERPYHPITPHPLPSIAILLKTVTVCITGSIKPTQGHTLAIMFTCKQTIHEGFISLLTFICYEVINFFGSRGQASKIDRKPFDKSDFIRFR